MSQLIVRTGIQTNYSWVWGNTWRIWALKMKSSYHIGFTATEAGDHRQPISAGKVDLWVMGHSDSVDASSDETKWYAWLFSMRGFELHPNPINRWNVVPKPWISLLIQMTCTKEQRLSQATHRTHASNDMLGFCLAPVSLVHINFCCRRLSLSQSCISSLKTQIHNLMLIWPLPSAYNWLGSNVHKILAPHLHTQWENLIVVWQSWDGFLWFQCTLLKNSGSLFHTRMSRHGKRKSKLKIQLHDQTR